MREINSIYGKLLQHYGAQGWWPISGEYRKNDFSTPRNEEEQLEVCFGAILAQGINWQAAQKAVFNLSKLNALDLSAFEKLGEEKIREAVKPAGYFNQKARKLLEFSEFYSSLQGKTPSREELLGVWGVGEETADSILLYAYRQPQFVVDAYAKRIFCKLGLIDENASYAQVKKLLEDNLPLDYKLFNEFHALLVEHAKRHYSKKPFRDLVLL
ncbi:endonuclease III domain-containing protein [Candidatus Micrarchaeota archaeon]|nr:endonuclease III domain-containing protein [Candidatus Micrarchaeota archaeon]